MPFSLLLQLHTLHVSKAGAEIWPESVLKFHMISLPQIIKYITVTRKHNNLILLEVMTEVHSQREMTSCYHSLAQGGAALHVSRILTLK